MRRYLYFTVFFAGMTTLAAEFAASRLLDPAFGNSQLVWASVIGLILIYLTGGYYLGGRLADRNPTPQALFTTLAWGAFALGVVPLVAHPVISFAASAFDALNFGILGGSFAAVLILFSVPITLLGTVSPFAVRLLITDQESAGKISGNISAISTIGSFAGTFLAVIFFIPVIGTLRTFLVFSGSLFIVALIGIAMVAGVRKMLPYTLLALIVAVLAAWSLNQPIKRTAGQVFEQESAYNYIEVIQRDEFTYLRLNDGQGVHSQYHPEQLFYGGPWEQFLVGPFFSPHFEPSEMKRIAIIGLAAGTTARQASEVFGAIPIDGYEIDPAIIDVGRKYFAMTMPNLNAVAADGRWGLAHSGQTYTLIAVDAYRPPYIPPHLTTREFFQMAFDRLDDNGALAINVGRAPEDRRLIEDLAATIGAVFPSVFVMDIPYTFNSIIYATKQPGSAENLAANYMALESGGQFHPLLKEAMFSAFANLQPTPQGGIIFTDDRAPIEWITNDMIVRFLLAGGAEDLQ